MNDWLLWHHACMCYLKMRFYKRVGGHAIAVTMLVVILADICLFQGAILKGSSSPNGRLNRDYDGGADCTAIAPRVLIHSRSLWSPRIPIKLFSLTSILIQSPESVGTQIQKGSYSYTNRLASPLVSLHCLLTI